MNRRSLLGFIAVAPFIVKASSIMPVRALLTGPGPVERWAILDEPAIPPVPDLEFAVRPKYQVIVRMMSPDGHIRETLFPYKGGGYHQLGLGDGEIVWTIETQAVTPDEEARRLEAILAS